MIALEVVDTDVLPSDIAFDVFMATVTARDLSPFEYQLYQWHRLRGSAA